MLVAIPIMQSILIAKPNDMLHLSQVDASQGMVCVSVRRRQVEPRGDSSLEIVVTELFEGLGLDFQVLHLNARVKSLALLAISA